MAFLTSSPNTPEAVVFVSDEVEDFADAHTPVATTPLHFVGRTAAAAHDVNGFLHAATRLAPDEVDQLHLPSLLAVSALLTRSNHPPVGHRTSDAADNEPLAGDVAFAVRHRFRVEQQDHASAFAARLHDGAPAFLAVGASLGVAAVVDHAVAMLRVSSVMHHVDFSVAVLVARTTRAVEAVAVTAAARPLAVVEHARVAALTFVPLHHAHLGLEMVVALVRPARRLALPHVFLAHAVCSAAIENDQTRPHAVFLGSVASRQTPALAEMLRPTSVALSLAHFDGVDAAH